MKTILALLLFASSIAYSQTNTFPSSGNVGIGTTTPSGKLDINNAGGQLRLSGGTVAAGVWTNNTDILYLADWSTGTKGLSINLTTGNTGIGTTSPSAKLDVNQSGGESGQNLALKIRAGNSQNYFGNTQLSFSYAGGIGYSHAIKTRHNASNISGNAFDFYVWQPGDPVNGEGSLNVMTLNGNKVGIGTNSPNSSLSVKGRIGVRADAAPSAVSETMRIEGAISSEENVVNVTNLADQDFIVRLSAAGAASKRTIIGPSVSNRFSLGVGVNSGNEYLTIINSGNVGIGTINPNQKLTVNGTIYGKEVKIDLSVPGPDYVFEPSYNLPSLEELQNYINQNKHLPEVPSAKEMEQNGINVGEMNMILLKKVEELTLYVIELKKDIEELKIENRELRAQLKKQSNQSH